MGGEPRHWAWGRFGPADPDELRRREWFATCGRWIGVAVGLVGTVDGMLRPEQATYLTSSQAGRVTAGIVLVNLVFTLLWRWRPRWLSARGLTATGLLADVTIVTVVVALGGPGLWPVLLVLPAAGAIRFELGGALLGGIAATAGHVGVGLSYPDGFETVDVEIGIIAMLTVMIGLLSAYLAHERQRAEQALGELREVEAWRSRLLSTLAHDVRSPLGSVMSSLLLLEQRDAELDSRTRISLVRGAHRQAERIHRLASDLLDMARSETGRLRLRPRPIAVDTLIHQALDVIPEDTAVEVDVEPGLEAVADPARLEQVVVNLVQNALRHGAPPVVVAAARSDDAVLLSVTDAGDGVPDGLHPRLFDRFASGTEGESVGLGLWIVGQLVNAHGGTVTYEHAEGGGAHFEVVLPQPAPFAASAANATAPSTPARSPSPGRTT